MDRILKDLASTDEALRERAFDAIYARDIAKRDLPKLYKAIRRDHPDDHDEFHCARSQLLSCLWDVHDGATTGFIRGLWPTLPPNADIRFSALRVLSGVNTKDSLTLLLSILLKERPVLAHDAESLFMPVLLDPKNAGVLFPGLLELVDRDEYRADVYRLAARAHAARAVDEGVFAPFKDHFLKDYTAARKARRSSERGSIQYFQHVNSMSAILDVLSTVGDDPKVLEVLTRALKDERAAVMLSAGTSLMVLGRDVASTVIEKIAADPATRLDLLDQLKSLGKTELFPTAYYTQVHVAEGDLVRWLSHFLEYGRPPDKIRFHERREVHVRGKKELLYIFKFTYPEQPRRWLIGLSGPQPYDESKINTAGLLTSSSGRPATLTSVDEECDLWVHGFISGSAE